LGPLQTFNGLEIRCRYFGVSVWIAGPHQSRQAIDSLMKALKKPADVPPEAGNAALNSIA
jgi:hypothetical protein